MGYHLNPYPSVQHVKQVTDSSMVPLFSEGSGINVKLIGVYANELLWVGPQRHLVVSMKIRPHAKHLHKGLMTRLNQQAV